VQGSLVGRSPAWISVLRQIVEVASFTDASVLITGESGTGKELIARLIHTLDARPEKRDLVVLDCTTIVPELSGSEFFGHERGAFTGAISPRDGAFAWPTAARSSWMRLATFHLGSRLSFCEWYRNIPTNEWAAMCGRKSISGWCVR
jgi:sigma54-dependent transcription regulator